ncbi:MAG: T9SS type A sorting domain-containing protein [Bacteroidetes bacterium]|nr:T9SS type A sorting domain-containing protein [Bacteroidota bacterium]
MRFILGFIAVFALTSAYAQKAEWPLSSGDFSKRISVFPNPVTEVLTVSAEGLEVGDLRIGMFNIIGNEVSVEPEFSDGAEIRIRIKDLPSGFYLLSIRDEKTGQKTTKKFLKR